jgi:NRAMP (natural resistance-associated macrophage protein)-like metal ion transporter
MGAPVNSGTVGPTFDPVRKRAQARFSKIARLFRLLGPGLVTGAADDDPSGIATYSQVGAQFGFSMMWAMLFSYPLMAAIQEISAWIGRVTGAGLTRNLKMAYPPVVCFSVVAVLLFANVINLAADIAAMGDAVHTLIVGPAFFYSLFFGVVCLLAEIFIPYEQFARILKWATLVLFVYVGTAFTTHLPLREVLKGTLLPSLSFSSGSLTALTAVLGTTISPYLFFWQASQEVEEQKAAPAEQPLKRAPQQARAQLEPMRIDTYFGMAVSNIVGLFIILATGATLHQHGVTDIQTATQAADALRPVAGDLAFLFFLIGIVGTGLLAIPVLAGSVGYAVAELKAWPIGLDRPVRSARGFYATIAAVTLLGMALNYASVSPIKALFWSAVINGLSAGPIMILIMLIASDRRLTGKLRLPKPQWIIGWTSTLAMLTVAVGMLVTALRG